MTESNPEASGPESLFLGLVQSFQVAAMQQMGKTMNPFTERIERDLAQAKLSIDMLEMLRVRTSGNLTSRESRLLDHVLTELRLNYVAEVDEERKRQAAGGEGTSGGEGGSRTAGGSEGEGGSGAAGGSEGEGGSGAAGGSGREGTAGGSRDPDAAD